VSAVIVNLLKELGAHPVLIPETDDDGFLERITSQCSALLLPSGLDIDPSIYRESNWS
jgi:gamma-glutamyl-gamma-aminobutyrate hydrolase PuuD